MAELTQWEYKTIENNLSDTELNKLGKDGWEATCTASRNGYTDRILLKRPVNNQNKQTNTYDYGYSR